MRILALCATIALCLGAAGCLEMAEEVWINEDGTRRLVIDIGIAESLMAMGESFGGEMESEGPLEAIAATKEELAAHPGVLSAESREYTEAGIRHLVMDVTVKDFRDLPELHQETMSAAEGEEPVQAMFTLEEIGKRRYRFVQTMGLDEAMGEAAGQALDDAGGEAMDDPLGGAGEDFAKGMMAMMFEGKSFSVTVHAPKIESANGELAGDGKSVTWSFPFTELMTSDGVPDELVAEIEISRSLGDRIKGAFGKD